MKRTFFSWWLALVALACCAGLPASAQERSGRAKSAKDPVETAFELPQGTQLTSRQAKALNKMHQEYEPQLRDAIEKMNTETNAKTKRIDAKDALRIRQTIRGKIDEILNSNGAYYEASPNAGPATYESRYPTSSGTGAAPYNYYAPYTYPVYPYPYYPGVAYPYYSRSYYGPVTTTTNTTSQNKTTSTTRPAPQASTTRPPTTSGGGARYPNTTKR